MGKVTRNILTFDLYFLKSLNVMNINSCVFQQSFLIYFNMTFNNIIYNVSLSQCLYKNRFGLLTPFDYQLTHEKVI